MLDFQSYGMRFADATRNKGLLETVSGAKDGIKIVSLEFVLTEKGVGLAISGTRETAALCAFYGEQLENWINDTSDVLGNDTAIKEALVSLHEILIAGPGAAAPQEGGGDNA